MQRIVVILSLCILSTTIYAQGSAGASPIIFIYDASGSMWGDMQGKTKEEIAVSVLSEAIAGLPANQKIGLVAYGHREKENCEDVEFLVEATNDSKEVVIAAIKKINPLGKTPLSLSARQVIQSVKKAGTKATIILVTDGIESCGGNICDVVKTARHEGIDFRLHIIGFGLQAGEVDQLRCAAEAGNGQYFDAADASGLGTSLQEATSATVDEPPGNISINAVKNGKPIDALVEAYAPGTKNAIKVARTYADTAFIFLPAGKYELKVKPLENSDVSFISLPDVQPVEGKIVHHMVSFDAGKINVMTYNNGVGCDALVHVYDGDKIVTQGRTYGKETVFDVNPGMYDIVFKAISVDGADIEYRKNTIEVKAKETSKVEHRYKTGSVMVGARSSGGLVDAVISILDKTTKKSVASGRTYTQSSNNPKKFILTTGTYEITLSALGDHKGKKKVFVITVNEGDSIQQIGEF